MGFKDFAKSAFHFAIRPTTIMGLTGLSAIAGACAGNKFQAITSLVTCAATGVKMVLDEDTARMDAEHNRHYTP